MLASKHHTCSLYLGHLSLFRCIYTTLWNITFSKSNHTEQESSASKDDSHRKANPARSSFNCMLGCFPAYMECSSDGDQKWARLHQIFSYSFLMEVKLTIRWTNWQLLGSRQFSWDFKSQLVFYEGFFSSKFFTTTKSQISQQRRTYVISIDWFSRSVKEKKRKRKRNLVGCTNHLL